MKLRQRAGRFTRRGLSALPGRVASDGRDPRPLEAPCGRISASGGLTGATSPPTFRSATRTPPVTASLVSRARLFATGSMRSDTLRPAGAHTGAHELRFSEFAGRTPQRIRSRKPFQGITPTWVRIPPLRYHARQGQRPGDSSPRVDRHLDRGWRGHEATDLSRPRPGPGGRRVAGVAPPASGDHRPMRAHSTSAPRSPRCGTGRSAGSGRRAAACRPRSGRWCA
jgi:hypothetical protein